MHGISHRASLLGSRLAKERSGTRQLISGTASRYSQVVPRIHDARVGYVKTDEANGQCDVYPPPIWPWPKQAAAHDAKAREPDERRIRGSKESYAAPAPARLRRNDQRRPSQKIDDRSHNKKNQPSSLSDCRNIEWHQKRQENNSGAKDILTIAHKRWNVPPELL